MQAIKNDPYSYLDIDELSKQTINKNLPEFLNGKNVFLTQEKYLGNYEFDEFKRVEINTAFFGSGKTQMAINHYKQYFQNIIIINPTRSLINDVTNRFNEDSIEMKNHLELNKSNTLSSYDGCLNITLESLHHIDFSQNMNSMFILDEFNQLLSQLFSPINKDRREKMLESLKYILKYCKVAIFDALLGDNEYNLIKELVGSEKEIGVTSNANYCPPIRPIHVYQSQGTIERQIHSSLLSDSEHNVLLLCDTVKESEIILASLEWVGEADKINLCRETRESIIGKETIDKVVREKKPRILAISPTGFVGLNINTKHFTSIYIIATNNNIKDYRVYIQSIHRDRNYKLPVHIYSKKYEVDINNKKSADEILNESLRREEALNRMFPQYLNTNGYWEPRDDYKPFKNYLAHNKESQLNNQLIGVSQFIVDFYSKYVYENNGNPVFKINYINHIEEALKAPEGTIETKEEKRDRLKSIPLIDKLQAKELEIARSDRDLTGEEETKLKKFELSEKLNIGFTDLDREEKINSVYDFSVRQKTIDDVSDRVQAFNKENHELIREEKKQWENRGVGLNPSSLVLEKQLVIETLKKFLNKEFDKTDIDSSLIEKLELATGKDFGLRFEEKIINTKHFRELVQRTGLESLAMDYAKSISKGDRFAIATAYKKELDTIFQREVEKWTKKNPSTGSPITNEKFLRGLMKKQDRFMDGIQSNYVISNIDILSDILLKWGIKINKVKKSGGIRTYKIDASLLRTFSNFGKILGEEFSVKPNENTEILDTSVKHPEGKN